MRKLNYTTENEVLAFCLHTIGVPLRAVWNKYTPKRLDALGCEKVTDALKAGKRGNVSYEFEPVDDLKEILAAFDQGKAELERGTAVPMNFERAEGVKLVLWAQMQTAVFRDLWRKRGTLLDMHSGETVKTTGADGWVTETRPGFKFQTVVMP